MNQAMLAARSAGCALLWFSTAVPAAVPAPPPGRLLAAQCAQCHGTNGVSQGGIDSLAGMPAAELIEEMAEMQADDPNQLMHRQARGYTDAQIQLIADYFSGLPATPGNDD